MVKLNEFALILILFEKVWTWWDLKSDKSKKFYKGSFKNYVDKNVQRGFMKFPFYVEFPFLR